MMMSVYLTPGHIPVSSWFQLKCSRVYISFHTVCRMWVIAYPPPPVFFHLITASFLPFLVLAFCFLNANVSEMCLFTALCDVKYITIPERISGQANTSGTLCLQCYAYGADVWGDPRWPPAELTGSQCDRRRGGNEGGLDSCRPALEWTEDGTMNFRKKRWMWVRPDLICDRLGLEKE